MWDPNTADNRRLSGSKGAVEAIEFSPDGKRLVWADGRSRVVLWDVEAGKQLHEWTFAAPIHSVAFHPQGLFLAAGTAAGTIHVFRPDPVAAKTSK